MKKITAVIVLFFFVFHCIVFAEYNTFEDYIDNEDYFIINIDIDNDGLYEQVISNKFNGNEIKFFKIKDGENKQILQSSNLSIDGGERFTDITPVMIPSSQQKNNNNPIVMTIINEIAETQFRHNIRYITNSNTWEVASTEYRTKLSNLDGTISLVKCEFDYQNIIFNENLLETDINLTSVVTSLSPLLSDKNLSDNRYCKYKNIGAVLDN